MTQRRRRQLSPTISTSGSNVDAAVKQEQIAIRQRIAYLESAIAASTSYLLTSSYQRELNYLKSILDESAIAVAPIAMSQVKYEEDKINSNSNSVSSLRNFTTRFLRS